VIPATLTGFGERAHLLSRDIDLNAHVSDIVGLFEYRDLHDVFLAGHSYGGTVITGVAERVPHRIRRLVYSDASVPRDYGNLRQPRWIAPYGGTVWNVGLPIDQGE
jgi:pimeloyl-ACP methyl ester carboxylesterase